MRTFLIKNKTDKFKETPIVKWGSLKDNTFFEGIIPNGYTLGINPSKGYIILDVDVKNDKNGFLNIPISVKEELDKTFNYQTKSGGQHYWIKRSSSNFLKNTSTSLGLDLRTEKGYVKWYYRNTLDIRNCIDGIKSSSIELEEWLKLLFS